MKLYLGVWQKNLADAAPQFMFSARKLMDYKNPVSFGKHKSWFMDSGAFSEININGHYTYSIDKYLKCVELHQPSLFFNMDFMCEPFVIQKTNLSIAEHQVLSTINQMKIMDSLKNYNIKGQFAGVIQGWEIDDYLAHIDLLRSNNLILPYMGIGSICRRNATEQIIAIIEAVKKELPYTKLHGFGIKTEVLQDKRVHHWLHSGDSMAWSFAGRYVKVKPCNKKCIYPNQKNCANCRIYMMKWYKSIPGVC